MDTAHTDEHAPNLSVQQHARRAAINGLAVVGFIALIFLGVMLAIYGARFVPDTISRLTSAVYLSSEPETQAPAPTATTTVTVFVPVPATTTPATTPAATTTPAVVTPPSTGGPLIVRQPTYYYTNQPRLYGLPDLSVEIIEVGYLRTSSPSSFRRAREVPEGERGAFRFTVRNGGTNATGLWRFRAELPTKDNDDDTYTSGWQTSLMPGASKTYTIGFDDPDEGDDRRMKITVDYNDSVNEINERNNDDSARIDVERD